MVKWEVPSRLGKENWGIRVQQQELDAEGGMRERRNTGCKDIILGLSLVVMTLGCTAAALAQADPIQTRYEEQLREIKLITFMESALFAMSEAEKLAVMAETDEASLSFADKARSLGDELEKSRDALLELSRQAKLEKETALLTEFDACWKEYRQLDAEILGLAVKNTNLKAARLSQGKALALVGKLGMALDGVVPAAGDQQLGLKVKLLGDEALLAVQWIQILLDSHNDEADAKKMDALEQEMKARESKARKALEKMASLAGGGASPALAAATGILNEYMSVTAEIVALSRQNTNVDSLRLSLSRKRVLTATCSETLEALKKAAFDRGFKATK